MHNRANTQITPTRTAPKRLDGRLTLCEARRPSWKRKIMRITTALAVMSLSLAVGTAGASAEDAYVRQPLQKSEYPAGYESHIMLVTSAPGALLPRHTHPGVELSYVVEGELTVTIEGRPDFVVKAGSSFSVSPGVAHSARNTASTPTKVIAVFVIEKGKPVALPAP
jgi:quercetin dioxygenase-like cupin family protein